MKIINQAVQESEQTLLKSKEYFRLSEITKHSQCWKCRAMLGLLYICPYCNARN